MAKTTSKKTAIMLLSIVILSIASVMSIYSYNEIQHLRAVEAVYNKGISLMNEKKYLEAEKELSKIPEENINLYNKAQDKISESKEQYVKQNIELADSAIKKSNYKDSAKYLDEALKVDSKNEEANKLKNTLDTKIQEEFAKYVKKQEKEAVNKAESNMTPEEAVKSVIRHIKNNASSVKYSYDHTQKRDDKSYYVIQVYEDMKDHTATLGWYYVDSKTGKVYEWNLVEDKLNLVK